MEFKNIKAFSNGNKNIKEIYYAGNKIWPAIYTAKDSDFSGTTDGNFKYIGTNAEVRIPHIIKGVPVTSYASMFRGTNVTKVVSNNPNITNMYSMFRGSQATSLDLSNFDTTNVTDMSNMFYDSQAISLDLSSFNTSNVTTMYYMFLYSSATTLDLSSFNTSNVTNMHSMFKTSQATSLDLSSFNTSNVVNMNDMFLYASARTGYARTQADANKFNSSKGKPERLKFVVR